eukprot:8889617-Pyramimonas_sp.AAC.1
MSKLPGLVPYPVRDYRTETGLVPRGPIWTALSVAKPAEGKLIGTVTEARQELATPLSTIQQP